MFCDKKQQVLIHIHTSNEYCHKMTELDPEEKIIMESFIYLFLKKYKDLVTEKRDFYLNGDLCCVFKKC